MFGVISKFFTHFHFIIFHRFFLAMLTLKSYFEWKKHGMVFSTDSCNSKTRSDSIKHSVSEDYCSTGTTWVSNSWENWRKRTEV